MPGQLRLIRGRKGGIRIGAGQMTVFPANEAPEADAVVVEEDTWLVLSAEPKVTLPTEHPLRIFHELQKAQPQAPGTVIVRLGRPLTLMAVVYDLGAEPNCQCEWLAAAFSAILRICREQGVRSVALPLLGVRHGRMRPEDVLSLFIRVMREEASDLVDVSLHVPPGTENEIWQLLAAIAGSGPEAE